MSKGSNFWRQAGMSYLQYVGVSSNALRNGLKEAAKAKTIGRDAISYNHASAMVAGHSAKTHISSLIPK